MIFRSLTRLSGAFLVLAGLAGCVNVTMELQVLDENTARGMTTIVMDREFYDTTLEQGDGGFCKDEGVLTLSDDAATCVTTEQGTFAELLKSADSGEPVPTITNVGSSLVRVTFPTASLSEQFANDGSDPETLAMMQTFFEDRTFTLKVSGGQIGETNMTISEDGQSAALVIPFLDLINGEADLPDEAFAVVQLK